MRKTKEEKLANNVKKRYLHATFHEQTTDIKWMTSDAPKKGWVCHQKSDSD